MYFIQALLTCALLYIFLIIYFEIIFQQGYYDQGDGHALHDASANAESKKEDDLDLIGIINYVQLLLCYFNLISFRTFNSVRY